MRKLLVGASMLMLAACSSGETTAGKYDKVPGGFCAVLDFGLMADRLGPLDADNKETAQDGENPSHTCAQKTTGAESSSVTLMIIVYPSAERAQLAYATSAPVETGYPSAEEIGLQSHEWSSAGSLVKLRGVDANLMLAVNVVYSADSSHQDAVDVAKDLASQILDRMPATVEELALP